MTPPKAGVCEQVAPGVRRLLAPNPGPMTYWGTNTYLIGTSEVAVVDPGPTSDTHLNAILLATTGRVSHILITHAHRDHTGLVPALASATHAPVFAFGPPEAGRSETMQRLALTDMNAGGEGVDAGFSPDEMLADGDTLDVDGHTLEVLHTPGHFAGHLSFRLNDILFSGDHVMAWSTTLISPPDGDLTAFMTSTRKLQNIGLASMLPGHGPPVMDPEKALSELLAHRLAREVQILDALEDGAGTLTEITPRIYQNLAPTLLPAASRNVFAHLVDLATRNRVNAHPELSETATFSRA